MNGYQQKDSEVLQFDTYSSMFHSYQNIGQHHVTLLKRTSDDLHAVLDYSYKFRYVDKWLYRSCSGVPLLHGFRG